MLTGWRLSATLHDCYSTRFHPLAKNRLLWDGCRKQKTSAVALGQVQKKKTSTFAQGRVQLKKLALSLWDRRRKPKAGTVSGPHDGLLHGHTSAQPLAQIYIEIRKLCIHQPTSPFPSLHPTPCLDEHAAFWQTIGCIC